MDTPLIEARPDDYVDSLPVQIQPDVLRGLSERNSYRAAAHILLEWILIFGAGWICSRTWHPALYIMAIFWIGGRQHALAVLMHDGAHYLLNRNRVVNDWISDIFLAWPLLITTEGYRVTHWEHHRHTNTEKDPDCMRKLRTMDKRDWEYPASWRRLLLMVLKDLSGVGFYENMKGSLYLLKGECSGQKKTRRSTVYRWARLIFYVSCLGAAFFFGFWKGLLLFWIVPFMTSFTLILRIRAIAEHFATENNHPLNITRTTLPAWWEQIFFPKNVNYHLDHHLYPSVPFYRLTELHKVLMAQPRFRKNAHITRTYCGVLRECIHFRGSKRTCLQLSNTAAS